MKKIFFLSFVLLFFQVSIFSQTEIQEVDFKNFTYKPLCAEQTARDVPIKDGSFYQKSDSYSFTSPVYFSASVEGYADVDGDGNDEAIIISLCNTGGTGNFTEGFIYGLKDGKPTLLTRIEGGDRAFGGLRKITFIDPILFVERSSPGELGGACCPEKIETTNYQFENNSLKKVGEKTVRDIYPARRIEFESGKDNYVFDLNISREDQIKRFVFRAKKGQTLEVLTSDPKARVRLYKGNAKILNEGEGLRKPESTNRFAAKLKETGDFIFEIANFSDEDLQLNVTVKIN